MSMHGSAQAHQKTHPELRIYGCQRGSQGLHIRTRGCKAAESADMPSGTNRSVSAGWTAAHCNTPSRLAACILESCQPHKEFILQLLMSKYFTKMNHWAPKTTYSPLRPGPVSTLLFAKLCQMFKRNGKGVEWWEQTSKFGSVVCWLHFSKGEQPVSSGNLDLLQLHVKSTFLWQTVPQKTACMCCTDHTEKRLDPRERPVSGNLPTSQIVSGYDKNKENVNIWAFHGGRLGTFLNICPDSFENWLGFLRICLLEKKVLRFLRPKLQV